jgi:8-oxo-dGTP diphosphatase
MPPSNRVHAGVAAVVAHEGQLLMVQRAGADGEGSWSVPGGWIDHEDVDAESAAVRETREETSVWVEPHAAAGHTLHVIAAPESRAGDKGLTVFVVCQYVHGEPQVREPDKCPAVAWVPLAEVADRPLFEPLAMWWPVNGRYLMAS